MAFDVKLTYTDYFDSKKMLLMLVGKSTLHCVLVIIKETCSQGFSQSMS